MSFAPTLTPYVTADPCPRAEVLFSSFASGTTRVDVYRLAAGRTYKVRGAMQTPVAGALSRIDFEIPFGVPATYRAEQFDSAGLSLGFTDSASLTMNVADTWVHNPLDPQGAVKVVLLQKSGSTITRPFDGDIVKPLGRPSGVVVATIRRGVTDVPLEVLVESYADADKVQEMLGGYDRRTVPVLCFRLGTRDQLRLPKPFFAGVLALNEQDLTYGIEPAAVQYSMQGTEVDPPTPALVVPLLTRADINAAFPTRAALNAAALTRLDINRMYELAGTA